MLASCVFNCRLRRFVRGQLNKAARRGGGGVKQTITMPGQLPYSSAGLNPATASIKNPARGSISLTQMAQLAADPCSAAAHRHSASREALRSTSRSACSRALIPLLPLLLAT